MKFSSGAIFIFVAFFALLGAPSALGQSDPPTDADCTSEVPFANPDVCSSYYQCFLIDGTWTLLPLDCAAGGIWDDVNKACIEGTCDVTTTTTTTTVAPTTTPAATTSPTTPPTTAAPTTTTTQAPTTKPTTTKATTTKPPATTTPPAFVCTAAGFFAHPTEPTKYYQCVLISLRYYAYLYTCPPAACFQASAKQCVLNSCPGATPVPPPTTTTKATTKPPPPPTTTTPTSTTPVQITCPAAGNFPYPGTCTRYYKCVLISGRYYYYLYDCQPGTYFNLSNGLCTVGTCPASSTKAKAIAVVAAVTTPTPTTTTTAASATTSTTAASGPTTTAALTCPSEGFFPNPNLCTAYYKCVKIGGKMYTYKFNCPPTSYFSESYGRCVVGVCPAV